MRPLVALLDSAAVPDSTDCLVEHAILASSCELRQVFVRDSRDILAAGADADAILLWHHVLLTAEHLKHFRRCRVIVRNGVGFDNVDVAAAGELGIPVCNVPDYGTEEVADHALALILALTRRLLPATADVRGGRWNWRASYPVHRTSSLTLGIVGLGRIGTATALRAKAVGFRVGFYDPYLPDGTQKALGVDRCYSLRELLGIADVVSIHTPLNGETRHLFSEEAIGWMKPGAVLVNTARGPVVQESALVAALEDGHLQGAGLDVVEYEPVVAPALLAHPNCIVTPHSAFYSEESWQEMREKSALTVLSVLRGECPRNVVNESHLRASAVI